VDENPFDRVEGDTRYFLYDGPNVLLEYKDRVVVVVDERIGQGNGAGTRLAGTFAHGRVSRGSVQIVAAAYTITDDGQGVLTGPSGITGTINYKTGAWTLDFGNVVLGVGEPVLADCRCRTAPEHDVTYLHGVGYDNVLAEELASGQVYWFLTDHLGSITDVVDNNGDRVDHVQYTAYGQVASRTNAALQNRYLYTGREYDAETGLYYYRARYYDPVLRRFLSLDPMGLAGRDVNLYRYVGNTPTTQGDPTGNSGLYASSMRDMENRFKGGCGLKDQFVAPNAWWSEPNALFTKQSNQAANWFFGFLPPDNVSLLEKSSWPITKVINDIKQAMVKDADQRVAARGGQWTWKDTFWLGVGTSMVDIANFAAGIACPTYGLLQLPGFVAHAPELWKKGVAGGKAVLSGKPRSREREEGRLESGEH